MALEQEALETPAGLALVGDAARRVERLAIGERFQVKLGRQALLPIAAAALAVLLALFLPPPPADNQAQAKTSAQQELEAVKKSSETLRKQLEQRKQQAEEKGLKDAEELFARLEAGLREATQAGKSDRKQALVKLNDLAKELEQRRQSLGSADQFKQQLEQLKQLQQGPADRMLDALKNGDLNKAAAELDKLRDQLAKGQLDPQQREDLAKQLEQMQQKLQAAADAQQQAVEQLQKQIDAAQAAGRQNEADRLQQQLDQMRQKMPDNELLRQMANQLGNAAQAAKNNQGEQAADALQQLGDQLADLQQQLEEAEMLDLARDQIAEAKRCMNCGECQGEGCQACKGGLGEKLAQGQGQGQGIGDGLGRGQGQGIRPEQEGATASYDTQVRQKVGKGSALVTGFVDGPNAKGNVQAQIKTDWESVQGQQSDPVADQPLPRNYRDHARRYFDALRTGQ